MRGSSSAVEANGVELAVETFGDADDPALLLISGSSMLAWDAELCNRLAAGGRFVLRYDLRDHGQSTTCPPGEPNYTLRDLATDAIALLDAFDMPVAHVAGHAVGGWVAQLAALAHPERLASLTLVSTRPTAHGRSDPDLPEHSDEVMAHVTGTPPPPWSDRAAVIEHQAGMARVCSATSPLFDEAAARALAGRVFDRAKNMASCFNIAYTRPPRWRKSLAKLTVPTLVVHGTHDGFFPYGNALALAREIPDATLLTLDDAGHELPTPTWDEVVAAMVRHTSAVDRVHP